MIYVIITILARNYAVIYMIIFTKFTDVYLTSSFLTLVIIDNS